MSKFDYSFYHTSANVEEVVREWFEHRALPRQLDGGRSILVAHPDFPGRELKLKGAGLLGGEIGFGKVFRSNLKMPVFDFDGRMMEDVASGPDNALPGGMSFQQAAAEHRMSAFLQSVDIAHVPCFGYGKIACEAGVSWFSLVDWDPKLYRVREPFVSELEYAEAGAVTGELHLKLALDYNLIGHTEFASDGKSYYLMDLHSFRQMDALNMSELSWVMQVAFNLHLIALERALYITDRIASKFPADTQAFPFRCVVPDVTKQDHEHFRATIVRPYMLHPPAEFSMKNLIGALDGNRLTRALRDICPREFARP
jgi:hypothetical protein